MVPNHHHHHHHLTLNHHHTETNASSSSSYRLFPFQDDQGVAYAHPFIDSNPSLHTHEVVGDVALGRKKEINDVKLTFLKSYNQDQHNGTTSPSPTDLKMRSFKTSMRSNDYHTINDQNSKRVDYSPREINGEDSSNNNNNESFGLIRACFDCGTTRTPLWRSGPYGPKSLCNACGIRQRKARRAAMAASDDTTCATNSNNNNNSTTKLNTFKEMGAPKMMKKRSKNHARKTTLLSPNNDDDNQTSISYHQTNKKISFEEFALDLSNRFSLHQFFQQDEKEAAILLMALSSGFVEG